MKSRVNPLARYCFILLISSCLHGCGHNEENACEGIVCGSCGYCEEERLLAFTVNEECSSDIPFDDCIRAIQSALDYWNSVECSDLKLEIGGITSRTDIGYSSDGALNNINLVVWSNENWDHSSASAYSSVLTCDESGCCSQFLDSDVIFNGVDYVFTEDLIRDLLIDAIGNTLGVTDADSLCRRFPISELSQCSAETDQ